MNDSGNCVRSPRPSSYASDSPYPQKGSASPTGSIGEQLDLPIVFESREMRDVVQLSTKCAGSDAPALISGESGTGKELIALLIHSASRRAHAAFVAVNMAALPDSLAEAELFGHIRGAFTGACSNRLGRFEQAHGGTIFIDEVSEISQKLQAKLLRVIQFHQIERLGENQTRNIDVRIIAATNRDLGKLVAAGLFREDLYFRLNVLPIHIPPLRDRRVDIPALVEHFVKKLNSRGKRGILGVSPEAMDLLMDHSYPGNVRELENLLERAAVFCKGEVLGREDFASIAGKARPGLRDSEGEMSPYALAMQEFERQLLAESLKEVDGNQSYSARRLGISERHLRSRLSHLGLVNSWRPGI